MLGYYQSLLEEAEIKTLVKNEYSQLAMGEIPFTQVYPELWVIDSEDYERALGLIRAVRDSLEETTDASKVVYKGSQMMKSIVRIGLMCLFLITALFIYSFLKERNDLFDSILQ